MTIESPCPYIKGNRERKIFTSIEGENGQHIQHKLALDGFRRSQDIVYKPICQDCALCISARIPSHKFVLSKSQRRILNKNKDIVREVRKAQATDEQYDLFERYVKARHFDGGMSDMSIEDFAGMVSKSSVASRIIEYRLLKDNRPDQLVACALTDILEDGLSMVYSFFDPDLTQRSLGKYLILDHIDLCRASGLNNCYLGYWVKNSPSMDYKRQFKPLELLVDGKWQVVKDFDKVNPRVQNVQTTLLNAHRKIFHG